MHDFENNNWIVLDPLRNIHELYPNLTVMITLLNLNYIWITPAELYLKGTFVKTSFMFVTMLTLPAPSILK